MTPNLKGLKFVYLSSKDGDLTDFNQTKKIFETYQPTYVIHLAAKVGGLFANMNNKASFYEENMVINMNIIKNCHSFRVKRLICALSTCIFPDEIKYPIEEKDLHLGPPHSSNEGYAYAKRMCEIQCKVYNEQFGTDYLCIIPTNLYGKHDEYNPERSHVVPAVIRKAHESKAKDTDLLVLGTGKPLRQFCYAPDLARLILWVMFRKESLQLISLVPEEEYSIKELAETVAEIVGVKGITFDETKADG